ncbi:MAG TPA: tRNA 2-thiouridine(34) synthase MnmA [Acidimicrobiales bacterium]
MQVLVAMSGGVDSSVAAALLAEEGHEVVGVTLRLWGGESDSGCCSVSDVDDARRVADQLGVEHLVFNFADDFTTHVVGPYVDDHLAGRTPNPCIECNRHLKFDRLLVRARALGFDAVATGHHARIEPVGPEGRRRIVRGVDPLKDQSYVIHMLGEDDLARVLLPIGSMTKDDVRARATALGLRTADKPDSQDVCFITHSGGGRRAFLGSRIPMRPGRLVDRSGSEVGAVDAVELVTVGQRKGLGLGGDGAPRYAVEVDMATATVVVGDAAELMVEGERLVGMAWADDEARRQALAGGGITAQCSAHGEPVDVVSVSHVGDRSGALEVRWLEPQRRVAPGQSIVLYAGAAVLGGGLVT